MIRVLIELPKRSEMDENGAIVRRDDICLKINFSVLNKIYIIAQMHRNLQGGETKNRLLAFYFEHVTVHRDLTCKVTYIFNFLMSIVFFGLLAALRCTRASSNKCSDQRAIGNRNSQKRLGAQIVGAKERVWRTQSMKLK